MIIRGQQPQPRKAKTFFVLDGKVHPKGIEEIEADIIDCDAEDEDCYDIEDNGVTVRRGFIVQGQTL